MDYNLKRDLCFCRFIDKNAWFLNCCTISRHLFVLLLLWGYETVIIKKEGNMRNLWRQTTIPLFLFFHMNFQRVNWELFLSFPHSSVFSFPHPTIRDAWIVCKSNTMTEEEVFLLVQTFSSGKPNKSLWNTEQMMIVRLAFHVQKPQSRCIEEEDT